MVFRAAAMAVLFGFLTAAPAAAQDVQLRSLDGSIELSGTLIGFDGEYYRVESIFGPLTISAEGVTCRGPGCPNLDNFVAEVRFAGAPAIADQMLPALIARFAAARGMVVRRQILARNRSLFALVREADETIAARFYVTSTTTDAALQALLDRDTDIALATRPPDAAEAEAARAADQGDLSLVSRSRVLALDALVVLVAPTNPADAITLAELASVFAGEIINWGDLGGPDAPVALHLMAEETGHGQDVAARVLGPFGRDAAPDVTRHTNLADLADAVARDPFAIGIGSYARPANARIIPLQGNCGFVQHATENSLKSNDYPLTAPLLAYLPVRRMPQLVRDFLRFFESQEADRVIRRLGFVNQDISAQPMARQGNRLANAILSAGEETGLQDLQRLITTMTGTERLSPTLRFEEGTTELDAQSLSAVSRLARSIEQGAFDGRELIFAGFSDGQGDAGANLRLSRGRSEAVRLAVIAASTDGDLNRVTLRTVGFREALPMACDDTVAGRAVNRRVEVWLR